MRAVTKEKLDQARDEIRKRKDKRNTYVKSWRQVQKTNRRVSFFVEEYVREKYTNIYSEAINFYSKLDRLYPAKIDLRKTKEFREWKTAIPHDTSHINLNTAIEQTEQQTDNLVLRIPLIPRPSAPQTPPEDRSVEISQEMPVETPSQQPSAQQEISSSELEIGAETTIEIPPFQFETQAEIDEGITDQRIRQIVEELQNDPDLNNLLNDIPPAEQNDEGIEVPTIEEEMRVDLALVDDDSQFSLWH